MSRTSPHRKRPLSPEDARRSIRNARAGLGLVALVTLAGTVLFAGLWQQKVEELLVVSPAQYATQGAGAARYYKGRLEEALTELVNRRQGLGPRPGEELPLLFQKQLQRLAADQPTTLPAVLTLLRRDEESNDFRPVARLVGRGQVADPPDEEFHPDGDLLVAVVDSRGDQAVVVRGPIQVGRLDGDLFRFRCVSVYHSFGDVAAVGIRYSLILLVSYLLLLYGLLFLGLRLRKRMTETVLAAREKVVRLEAMGGVAEGIAHEIRNPLNAISLQVQYMERLLTTPDKDARPVDYQRIYIQLGAIRKVIDNFVGFAKLRDMELSRMSLEEVVRRSLDECQSGLDSAGIETSVEVDGDVTLEGDEPKLTRVVKSLLENAMDAVDEQAPGIIRFAINGAKAAVTLKISDNGKGATTVELENMFEPYRTSASTKMGLGLTLARTVIESHGGTISVREKADGGCCITLVLPRTF